MAAGPRAPMQGVGAFATVPGQEVPDEAACRHVLTGGNGRLDRLVGCADPVSVVQGDHGATGHHPREGDCSRPGRADLLTGDGCAVGPLLGARAAAGSGWQEAGSRARASASVRMEGSMRSDGRGQQAGSQAGEGVGMAPGWPHAVTGREAPGRALWRRVLRRAPVEPEQGDANDTAPGRIFPSRRRKVTVACDIVSPAAFCVAS